MIGGSRRVGDHVVENRRELVVPRAIGIARDDERRGRARHVLRRDVHGDLPRRRGAAQSGVGIELAVGGIQREGLDAALRDAVHRRQFRRRRVLGSDEVVAIAGARRPRRKALERRDLGDVRLRQRRTRSATTAGRSRRLRRACGRRRGRRGGLADQHGRAREHRERGRTTDRSQRLHQTFLLRRSEPARAFVDPAVRISAPWGGRSGVGRGLFCQSIPTASWVDVVRPPGSWPSKLHFRAVASHADAHRTRIGGRSAMAFTKVGKYWYVRN